jgi:hypothetical protein
MGKAWDQYAKEMHERFGYLATWTPGVQLSLGDVGVVRDNVFTRLTTLGNLGISFKIRDDATAEDIRYVSSGCVSITFKAAGTAPAPGSGLTQAQAGVSIDFTRKKAVVFEALGCVSPSIDDQLSVGQQILSRYPANWNKDWVAVTELVVAKSVTVLISDQGKASLELSAKGNMTAAAFSLADLSAGLTVVSQRDMQTTIVAQAGLTPLFKARGIKSSRAVSPVYAARGLYGTDLDSPDDSEARSRLYFGNIGFDRNALDAEID